MKTILINGKSIVGLLDTGADVSCISGKDWPSSWPTSWPTHTTENNLVGIGRAPTVAKSAKILDWQFEDTRGTFQPYVVPSLPFTLWGRDVLSQMGVLLFINGIKQCFHLLFGSYCDAVIIRNQRLVEMAN